MTVEVAVAPFTKFPMDPISTERLSSLTIPGGDNPVEIDRESADDVVGTAVVVGAVMKE